MNSYRKIKSTDRFSMMLNTATPSVPTMPASIWMAIRVKTASKMYSEDVAKPSRRGLTASLKDAAFRCNRRFPRVCSSMYPIQASAAAKLDTKKPKLQPAMPQSKTSSSKALMIRFTTPLADSTVVEKVSASSLRR